MQPPPARRVRPALGLVCLRDAAAQGLYFTYGSCYGELSCFGNWNPFPICGSGGNAWGSAGGSDALPHYNP